MRGASRNRPRRRTTSGGTRRRREKRKKKRGRRRSRRRETRTRRRGRDEWRRSRSRRGERRESVALAEWTIAISRSRSSGCLNTDVVRRRKIARRRSSSPSPAASDRRHESASGFVWVRVWIWPFGRAATFTRARDGTSGSQPPSPGLDRPRALSRTRPFRADDARVRFGTFLIRSATTAPAARTPWREDSAASSPRKRT